MNIEFIDTFIKYIGIYISLCFCFIKIINYSNLTVSKKFYILIFSLILSYVHSSLKDYTPLFFRILIMYLSFSIILSSLTNTSFISSIITTLISMVISYTLSTISSIIVMALIFNIPLLKFDYQSPLVIIFISCLTFILVYLLLHLKRFKHGFPFLKNRFQNEHIDIIILFLNILLIFMYFFIGNFKNLPAKYLVYSLIFSSIITIVIIQKIFILYQKKKLQTNALKDYEQELQETKQKLSTAIEEKQKLVKSNHEFYHRQEALKKKLDDLINQQSLSMNTEFAEDYGDLLERINKLSDEYVSKTNTVPHLAKTNITEIDDMLSYMQSECNKNNIEFILKIDCDINHIINNYISKSQLETLLGDLIRNAIIAINHSSTDYKSIMVIFGIKDNSYELCIFDSGISFEIPTLVNLGLHPASTHENEGGTGIGFVTTFETINSCNASFIINEITNNNYTKSLEIKFDNKHEYIVISNRCNDIKKLNNLGRNIILKDGAL